jgi:hypothetical protein
MFKVKEGLRLFDNQTTVRYPTGNYGSFEIDGGAKSGGWEGYSIGGRVNFMHDNNSEWGIYNDVNNEWCVRGWFNGSTDLFFNGVEVANTTDRGFDVKNKGILQFGSGHSYKISAVRDLSASGTQAKRYEVARLAIDYNDWNSVGTLQIELHERYFDKGLIKKYHVWYGYSPSKGIQLYEITGTGTNNMRVVVGDEVTVSGDHRYVPVYVDIRYYTSCSAVFKTTKNITSSNPPSVGTMWLNPNPTGSNISDFSADNTVEQKWPHKFTSNVTIEGTTYLGTTSGDQTHINDTLYLGATDSGDSHFYLGENSSNWYGEHIYWDSGHNMYHYSRHAGTDSLIYSHDTRYTHKIKLARGLERTGHSTGYFIGSYNSVGDNATKTNPIYTIGDSYRPSDSSLDNMYGVGYCADSAGFITGQADSQNEGWGQYIAADGDARIFLGASKGNIYAKGYNHYFGESGDWDNADQVTRMHFRGHNQFWIGAGNSTWMTGTANSTARHDDLCTGESNRHDTLITTMQAESNVSRGITFGVSNNSAGTRGYRIGRWFSGDNSQANSMLVVDGQLFAKAGNTDEFDHYGNNYDSNRGGAHWVGDTSEGWHKPGVVSSRAIQIQSGNNGTNSNKPQLQFHQYGYGGPMIQYDGPNKLLQVTGPATRFTYFEVNTNGVTDGIRLNYDQIYSRNRPLYIQYSAGHNTYINGYSGGNVGIGGTSASERLHVHGNIKATGNLQGNLVGQHNQITVNGASDTFYPVVFSTSSAAMIQEFHIYRGYSDYAPNDWNTSSHKGGLSLKFDIRNGSWGGFTNDLTVYYFGESYSRIVGGIAPINHTMQFCVWLRGGGATYQLRSDQSFSYQVYDNVTASNYTPGQGWLTYNNANNGYDVYTNFKTMGQANSTCTDTIGRRMVQHADGSMPYITTAPEYTSFDMRSRNVANASSYAIGNDTVIDSSSNLTLASADIKALGGGQLVVAYENDTKNFAKSTLLGFGTVSAVGTTLALSAGSDKVTVGAGNATGKKIIVDPTAGVLELKLDPNTSPGHTYMRFMHSGDSTIRGSIYRSYGSIVYATSSDYRLKENVVPLTGAIEKLKTIPVYNFNFTENPEVTVDGFIAHELQEVMPEAVTGTKDGMRTEEYEITPAEVVVHEVQAPKYDSEGNLLQEAVTREEIVTPAIMGTREIPEYQGVDQSKLTPLLTAALQEALVKIEELEARIAALE